MLNPAELVKQLRKCVKEMGSRATSYIDQCTKLERDWGQQVRCKCCIAWACTKRCHDRGQPACNAADALLSPMRTRLREHWCSVGGGGQAVVSDVAEAAGGGARQHAAEPCGVRAGLQVGHSCLRLETVESPSA